MKYEAFIRAVVRSKDGKVVLREERCNTYVKNFMMLLNAGFKLGASSVVDTGGTTRSAGAKWSAWSNNTSIDAYPGWSPTAGEGDTSYGIVVGTSDVAVTVNDYKLGAQVPHGDANNQLHYYAVSLPDPTVDGNTAKQKISRNFANNGTVDVVVKEIGLIVNTSTDNYKVLIVRDVVTPLTIPAGAIATIDIILTVTA